MAESSGTAAGQYNVIVGEGVQGWFRDGYGVTFYTTLHITTLYTPHFIQSRAYCRSQD